MFRNALVQKHLPLKVITIVMARPYNWENPNNQIPF